MKPHVTAEWHNHRLVVFGCPDPADESHNCDAMGCGSVGPHVLERLSAIEAAQELYRLRERVAELEAPPVVPEGWRVHLGSGHRWYLYQTSADDYALAPPAAYRGLAWALEHDQRPPHEGDS